jgi:flagellar basal-body rod protein FlgB
MIGDSFHIDFVAELMSREQLRMLAVSNNIANVNTPSYKAFEFSFDSTVEQLVAARDKPFSGGTRDVILTPDLIAREDGNNVDIDLELGRLDKTNMLFNSYAQILGGKLAMLRLALS